MMTGASSRTRLTSALGNERLAPVAMEPFEVVCRPKGAEEALVVPERDPAEVFVLVELARLVDEDLLAERFDGGFFFDVINGGGQYVVEGRRRPDRGGAHRN